jgi:hypothetical protein
MARDGERMVWFRPGNRRGNRKRFTKKPFQKPEKTATICGKEHLLQPKPRAMATACKHPKVRIVSRHEDAEFVECLECGEVFDSEEFRDMEIEETAETEDVSDDA